MVAQPGFSMPDPTKKPKTPKTVKISLKKPAASADTAGDEARNLQRSAVMPSAPKITSVAPPITPYTPPGTGAGPTGKQMSTASVDDPTRSRENFPGSLATNPVTNSYNGFSSRYDPTTAPGEIYGDPNIILKDVLSDQGHGGSNSRIAAMGDYSQRMMDLAQMLSLSQGGGSQNGLSDETTFNTVAELLANAMGAGGSAVDYSAAMNMIMNPTDAMKKSLYGVSGDDSFGLDQQNQALQPMFMAAINGMNPYSQRAAASAYRAANTQAHDATAHGDMSNQTITRYLRQNLAGLLPKGSL